jgi:ribosomal protein S6
MQENKKDNKVYEISYLISSNVPEEKVSIEADQVRQIVVGGSSSIIAEEAPKRTELAYTIRKKTGQGNYDSHNFAYFGWVKFEANPSDILAIKKKVELVPSIIRMLMITTVRENTYLGKRATTGLSRNILLEEKVEDKVEAKEVAPVSQEEMDKSIDEMVKEA